MLIACPIEETDERNMLQLRKIYVAPNMKLVKCFLGFENEQKMVSNQNVQNMFKFCQFNADDFARMVDVEQLPQQLIHSGTNRIKGDGLKILNPLTKLLKTDKSNGSGTNSGHEKEDSIIFLSKNDLESLTVCPNPQASSETFASDRMKVFQPAKKSWFKNLRSKNNSFTQLDVQTKFDSIDRYKDMSKLIQERFGNVEDDVTRPNETTPPRPSSEIGFKNGTSDTLQKSFSLQDLDSKRPDILNVSATQESSSTGSMANNQNKTSKPFFSDKLYSEFHVKTKQHSKSSSSLHQLLHLGKTPKQEATTARKDEERYPFEIKFERKNVPIMFEPYDQQDDCSLTILDDLPYSSVRDSIIMQEEEEREGSVSPKAPSENIYAELFTNERESVSSGNNKRDSIESHDRERNVPNFHRISEINNSTRIRICLFNDDPNQSFTAKI